jgi:hypothetical protein
MISYCGGQYKCWKWDTIANAFGQYIAGGVNSLAVWSGGGIAFDDLMIGTKQFWTYQSGSNSLSFSLFGVNMTCGNNCFFHESNWASAPLISSIDITKPMEAILQFKKPYVDNQPKYEIASVNPCIAKFDTSTTFHIECNEPQSYIYKKYQYDESRQTIDKWGWDIINECTSTASIPCDAFIVPYTFQFVAGDIQTNLCAQFDILNSRGLSVYSSIGAKIHECGYVSDLTYYNPVTGKLESYYQTDNTAFYQYCDDLDFVCQITNAIKNFFIPTDVQKQIAFQGYQDKFNSMTNLNKYPALSWLNNNINSYTRQTPEDLTINYKGTNRTILNFSQVNTWLDTNIGSWNVDLRDIIALSLYWALIKMIFFKKDTEI